MKSPDPKRLYAAIPFYAGQRFNTLACIRAERHHRPFESIYWGERHCSLLAAGFNHFWVDALRHREEWGLTHFLLLHADVCPLEPHWLEAFYSQMVFSGAKVLSAVIPKKDDSGLTSTADERAFPECLSLKEAHDRRRQNSNGPFPVDLVNSGCLLVDLHAPEIDECYFNVEDAVFRDSNDNYFLHTNPEDWFFSRMLRQRGIQPYATVDIPIRHWGHASWSNQLET